MFPPVAEMFPLVAEMFPPVAEMFPPVAEMFPLVAERVSDGSHAPAWEPCPRSLRVRSPQSGCNGIPTLERGNDQCLRGSGQMVTRKPYNCSRVNRQLEIPIPRFTCLEKLASSTIACVPDLKSIPFG